MPTASNRGLICLFSENDTTNLVFQNAQFEFYKFYVIIACNFYALIGPNLTGEFMQKIYTASWNLFTLTAEVKEFFVNLWCFLLSFTSRKWKEKTFRRVLSYNFGCRKKAWSDQRSSALKTLNTRKPAKSFKLKLKD